MGYPAKRNTLKKRTCNMGGNYGYANCAQATCTSDYIDYSDLCRLHTPSTPVRMTQLKVMQSRITVAMHQRRRSTLMPRPRIRLLRLDKASVKGSLLDSHTLFTAAIHLGKRLMAGQTVYNNDALNRVARANVAVTVTLSVYQQHGCTRNEREVPASCLSCRNRIMTMLVGVHAKWPNYYTSSGEVCTTKVTERVCLENLH